MGAFTVVYFDGIEVPVTALNWMDKTDKELVQFRYMY